jgi:hypothetical protein
VTNVTGGRPFWSPDGTQIAWNGADGIYVSPAPVPGADDTCVLAPKLVVPGGNEVHWAPFDLTQPPAPGGGGTTTPPATTTPTPGGGTNTTTKPKTAAAFSAAKAIAAKRAFTLRLTLPKAATVRVTITRKGAKKALGTLTYKAKKGAFSRKITKVRGHRLSRGTYKIAIQAGTTKKTLTVSVK